MASTYIIRYCNTFYKWKANNLQYNAMFRFVVSTIDLKQIAHGKY